MGLWKDPKTVKKTIAIASAEWSELEVDPSFQLSKEKCRLRHQWEIAKLELKLRVDQTQYPMIVVASLSAVPQSCRTPLLKALK